MALSAFGGRRTGENARFKTVPAATQNLWVSASRFKYDIGQEVPKGTVRAEIAASKSTVALPTPWTSKERQAKAAEHAKEEKDGPAGCRC